MKRCAARKRDASARRAQQAGDPGVELNTRGRFAVMAIADLAKHGDGDTVALSQVAERQLLSLAYLEKLFGKLRAAGLVESERGRSGGYRLARPTDEIVISEILEAVEEPTRMTRCVGSVGCVGEGRCLTHGLWSALGANIQTFLSRVTIADVINDRVLAGAETDGGLHVTTAAAASEAREPAE
jgi:Rrf2 family protein